MRSDLALILAAAFALGCTAKDSPATAEKPAAEKAAAPTEKAAPAAAPTPAPIEKAAPTAAPSPAPTKPTDPLACQPVGDSAPILDKAALLLIGEMHGTREIPATVGELACLAGTARAVRVGLELSRADQPRIDRFMASDGSAAARDDLTGSQPWSWEFQDGRTSRAMVDLVDRLRRMKAAGRDVKVFGYDVVEFVDENARDASTAAHIAAARKAEPEATFIILSGNRHTQIEPERAPPGAPPFMPMGAHLARQFPDVVALSARSSGGQYWACVGPDPSACGPQDRPAKDYGRPGIYIDTKTRPIPPGHHGVLHVGQTTISPPARSAAK